jgi:hypothetical protein
MRREERREGTREAKGKGKTRGAGKLSQSPVFAPSLREREREKE